MPLAAGGRGQGSRQRRCRAPGISLGSRPQVPGFQSERRPLFLSEMPGQERPRLLCPKDKEIAIKPRSLPFCGKQVNQRNMSREAAC